MSEQILRLEKLLRKSDPPPSSPHVPVCGRIENLPLWRVQETILPGMQVILHVHVPHYVHMFQMIMAGPRPWRFGNLLLPEGSRNLGSPEYALRPHTRAPLTGTLAEILHCDALPDGRMLMLIGGLSRFRVVEERQALPFARADVELWADEEEVALLRGCALKALEQASQGLSLMSSWHLSSGVAAAAAAAAAQSWGEWEMREVRSSLAAEVAARKAAREQSEGGDTSPMDSLVWRGAQPHAPTTASPPARGPPRTGPEELLPLRAPRADGAEKEQAIILETVAAASAEAAAAAALAVDSARQEGQEAVGLPLFPVINSCIERGVLVHSIPEAIDTEISQQLRSIVWTGEDDTWAEVIGLEALTWRMLDIVQKLRSRAKLVARPLPLGLQLLRPGYDYSAASGAPKPPLAPGEAKEGDSGGVPEAQEASREGGVPAEEGGGEADSDNLEQLMLGCKYSALRRAQRLSFAVGAVLEELNQSEGRQVLLEVGSIKGRLQRVISHLIEQRNGLQLVLALVRLDTDGGKDIPVD